MFLVFIDFEYEKIIDDKDDTLDCVLACTHRKLKMVCKMLKLFYSFFLENFDNSSISILIVRWWKIRCQNSPWAIAKIN